MLIALVSALLAADSATYALTMRAEARETSPIPGEQSVNSQALQLDLGFGVNVKLGRWTLSAGYQPHIVALLPDQANQKEVTGMNSARLSAQYDFSPLERIRLVQSGTYGTQDNSPLGAFPPGTTPQQQLLNLNPQIPIVEILAQVSSTTQVVYDKQLAPELKMSAGASYSLGGGADSKAKGFLPFQHSLEGDASLGWQVDRHDRLTAAISASGSNFSDHSRSRIDTAALGFSSQLSADSSITATAGGGAAHQVGNGQLSGWAPAVSSSLVFASVLYKGTQRVSMSLRGGVNTTVDPLGQGVFILGDARAALIYEPGKIFRITSSGGFGRALTGGQQAEATLVEFSLYAGIALAPNMALEAGGRGAWQEQPVNTIGAAGFQYAGFVGFTLTESGHLGAPPVTAGQPGGP